MSASDLRKLAVDVKPSKVLLTTIVWSNGGSAVSVAGSFNGWIPQPLTQNGSGSFECNIGLPAGFHLLKFVVDGKWEYDPNRPYVQDQNGNINNFLVCEDHASSEFGLSVNTKGAASVSPSIDSVTVGTHHFLQMSAVSPSLFGITRKFTEKQFEVETQSIQRVDDRRVIPVREGLVIVMVGLPARGKTYIARKVVRFLRWMGHTTKLFNVGNYRRRMLGAQQAHDFFDPQNKEAYDLRKQMADAAMLVFPVASSLIA